MGSKKNLLICIDRDGTIIYDKKYHLGRQKNWKELIRILPGVVTGIKKLNKKFPNAKIYIITNQPGIAIKDFKLLTQKRSNEVCEYIIKKLSKQNAIIDGYIVCGKASLAYTKKRNEYKFNKKLVGNFPCIKPKPGMINKTLNDLKWTKKNTDIFVMGDRLSDIKTGLNAKGHGIFVPFFGRKEETKKVKRFSYKYKKNKIYISKGFLDGVSWIKYPK